MHMLLAFVLLCIVCIVTEMLLDDSAENRVITPLVGFVLTLLVCARFANAPGGLQESPVHVVHILLYVACLLYIRGMLDCVFHEFFLGYP
jgi:uncharacterized membrane protein YjjP (DUF1212 family)